MITPRVFALLLLAIALSVFLMGQVAPSVPTSREWQIASSSTQLPPDVAYPVITKFGFNGDVGTTPEVIWSNSGVFSYPAGPVVMSIASDDADDDGSPTGPGARTVRIQCLNANGDPAQEDLTLNGTTPVPMSFACLKPPYRIKVLTAGSNGANVGTLTISEGGTTYAEVGTDVAPGNNQTLQAAYTCPANTRCIIEWGAIGTDDNIIHGIFVRPPGEVFRPLFWVALDSARAGQTWWQCISALTDIEYRARAVTGNADVGAAFRVHHLNSGACS